MSTHVVPDTGPSGATVTPVSALSSAAGDRAPAPIYTWPYRIAGFASIQFMVLTAGAMVLYPGGTTVNRSTRGYSFLTNFFSDLGMTIAHNRAPNMLGSALFVVALVSIGAGLAAIMVVLPQLYRYRRDLYRLSLAGSAIGVVSGLAYIGIALTPANLHLGWHMRFVQLAFRSFLVVVILYGIATWLHRDYAKRYAVVWFSFAVVLAGYVWLLIFGPSARTPQGLLIQAAGQKIIAYSSIICVWWQCRGALQLATRMQRSPSTHTPAQPAA